ncbi:helix-turn-helix transcriptional regulator [Oharaeibacter diazotrophicus]|uniref:Regulatory LuxR family protein n=1 Tax=Oharaeibacter diazotrophicus TaxID=1920512 RepID=A0A4R6RIW7_9HYPH|nr:helix-turn-helix transcriptional regulator [Oharaeibacter diazotrophicus]TDP86324.1 regulatory LuxR family protein [Oharaeibacter diazotrophicus]BBE71733.1 transcriptional regulator NarL [Pleomorphomonas sp. SM30]GLS78499.1 helix-turn-helix transcriptional regulator [Oharaeibacter diazotrophicus]
MERGFAAWNTAVAAAVEAVGTPAFPRRLEAAMATLVDFDILMVFAYAGAATPVCLHHNMDETRAATVIHAYAAGPYVLDPFYTAATDPQVEGVRRLRDMAPDQFHNSEYWRRHYVRTGIRDEVGHVVRPVGWTGVVVSLTRPGTAPAFGRQDLVAIRAAHPVVRALAERHWTRPAAPGTTPSALGRDAVGETIARRTRGILTPREAEITWLILKGHSTRSIATRLRIAEGTVKIHRKNIYQKLAVSSQAALFAMFLTPAEG